MQAKDTLDLGPCGQVNDAEFDGQRKKRVVVKVMGALAFVSIVSWWFKI